MATDTLLWSEMGRKHYVAVAALLGLIISARPLPSRVAHTSVAPEYRITDLRAHLFFSDRGTFSDDLLKRKDLALWNTIIGAGDAGGPSSATLLVVEVSGEPGSYPNGRRVELAVRTARKEIFRRQLSLGVLGPQGHAYVAFWLYDTGCESLTVSTALLGQVEPTRRAAAIPFHCGE